LKEEEREEGERKGLHCTILLISHQSIE